MATSEIEKLERRYAENPQGLTFAPLAEIHRKSGDVARALELLKAGLELHPNYIPASIVLGRCHWDLGDFPAAESAFAHVLRLDDENVIALKSLADINERQERFGEAQRWLYRLVSVDRSNDEARQQLDRLETAKAQGTKGDDGKRAAAGLPPEVVAVDPAAPDLKSPEVAPKQPVADEMSSLDLTAAIAEPAAPSTPSEPSQEKAETKSGTLEFLDTSAPTGKPLESSGVVEEKQPNPPEEAGPVAGLISQEFEPPKEPYRLHPELSQEFESPRETPERLDVELTEEVELRSSGAAEFRMPNAAEDFMDLAARMNAARAESPPLDPPLPAAIEVSQPPAPEVAPRPVPAPTPPTAARSEAVSSETVPETTKPSYSARDTKGQSVASFFEALLAARPPGNSGPPAASPSSPASESAAPTSPVQDALSLSSVFGGTVPIPPAVPAEGQGKDAAVSFDDFFGSPAGGSRPLPKGSTDPGNDDLDQFQSWLQNLKR